MRRSAAPSVRSNIKRARFLPHVIQNISCKDKENECFPEHAEQINSTPKDPSNSSSVSLFSDQIAVESKGGGENIRSNEDVLDLILEDDISSTENSTITNNITRNKANDSDESSKHSKLSTNNLKPLKRNFPAAPLPNRTVEECFMTSSNCIYCIKNVVEASLFNVLWCKRSGKKHKTWEGDGILIVKTRSAVLKDFSGKTLDKGVGYKLKETESLEDGSKFFIGGKECEIQCKISEEECQSGKYCKCSSQSVVREEEPPVQIKKPC